MILETSVPVEALPPQKIEMKMIPCHKLGMAIGLTLRALPSSNAALFGYVADGVACYVNVANREPIGSEISARRFFERGTPGGPYACDTLLVAVKKPLGVSKCLRQNIIAEC